MKMHIPHLRIGRYLLSSLVVLSIAILSATANSTKKIIRAGGNIHYPPFEFLDENGNTSGFNIDIFKALMVELGYKYEIKLDYWNRVANELDSGVIDVVIGVPLSKDNIHNMRFTMPICRINRIFISHKSNEYRSLSDLKGKRIAVESGSWFHDYMLTSFPQSEIIESNTITDGLRMLTEGRCDAVLSNELVAQYKIRQNNLSELRIGSLGIEAQDYSMAVQADNEILLDQLNRGLQSLKVSGLYDQIYNKWFGIYEDQRNRDLIFIFAGVFLLVATLLVTFVWLLRRKVEKATRMLNYAKQEVEIAIDAGRISAWSYTIGSDHITSLHGLIFDNLSLDILTIYRRIHHQDAPVVRSAFKELICGEKTAIDLALRIKNEKGKDYRYFETKMLRVEATKELPIRIVGTLKEVTQDVLMKRDLKDYKVKTNFIVKSNEITLIQYNLATRTIERINSHESDTIISYTIDEYLDISHPDDRDAVMNFIDEMNRGSKLKIEAEYRLLSCDGCYDWFSVAAAAFQHDEQGQIMSYIGMRRNNTKWKNINNELIVMTEKAEASNHLKSAFLANMSHEIRTPLNAIIGFSELLTETSDPHEREQYINILRRNNELLLQLVGDVLELSGIDSGKEGFACSPFDFTSYFDDICTSFRLKETPEVKLIFENKHNNLTVYSDQKRISQLLTNFVNNAFKFTSKGSVTIGYEVEKEGLRIWVRDTGIGITAEDSQRIFARFEKVNQFAQGTGLGLAICKAITEALGGQIGVESEPGVGSTFWFRIPHNNSQSNTNI